MTDLQHYDEGEARCIHCGKRAVGPCASCHEPVCGDCCTLTEGGTQTWAICLSCDRKGGRTLAPAWRGFVLWLVALLVALVALVAVVAALAAVSR